MHGHSRYRCSGGRGCATALVVERKESEETVKIHWQYLKAVLRHKWFVFWACLQMGVPIWSAILHDWDKFTPEEWLAYARYFYGPKVEVPNTSIFKDGKFVPLMEAPEDVKRAFDYAWNLHQKRNKHHWQFWLLRFDKPEPTFSFQSHDGGASHIWVADMQGKLAALIFDQQSKFKADPDAERRLEQELNYIPTALPMPDRARREMLADWIGAGRAYNKDWTSIEPVNWWTANKKYIHLHPETQAWVEEQMQARRERFERQLHHWKLNIAPYPNYW
jgi:hypothetical protein